MTVAARHRPALRIAATIIVGAMPLWAAAADPQLRALNDRLARQQQTLHGVEAARGDERRQKLAEHMRAMNETLAQFQQLKPSGRMSLEQLRDWMNEHQRLMVVLMGQMMQEHHLFQDCPQR